MSGVAASGISNLYYQRETSLTLPLSAFQLWVNNERQGGCLACFLENYGYRFHRYRGLMQMLKFHFNVGLNGRTSISEQYAPMQNISE